MKAKGRIIISVFMISLMPLWAQTNNHENESAIQITVDDAVNYALEHSYTIRSAEVDLQTKGDATRHVLNAVFPTIQAGASLVRTTNSPTATCEADHWTAMGNLGLSLSYNASLITDLKKSQSDDMYPFYWTKVKGVFLCVTH